MTNNYFKKTDNKSSGSFYIVLLYLSFVWAGFYESSNTIVDGLILGYGGLFDNTTGNLFYNVFYILMYAGIELLAFELLFWIYKQFLSYKIYTFIVPADKFKVDCRVFFAIRNIFYGIFANLCFLYPFLYAYLELVAIVSVLIGVIAYAYHAQKTYAEPLIAHFVFKNFAAPIICYETIMAIYYFWRCM
jgi:hypothetical protein